MIAARGFEVHPIFSRDEIAAAREAIGAHMDGVARALCRPFEQSHPELGIDERLDAIAREDRSYAELLCTAACTDAHLRPELERMATSPRLRARVEALLDAPIGGATARLRANVPALPHRRQPWHSDVARADGTSCARIRIAAWIPLSDVDEGSGTLEIAEGLRDAPLPHDTTTGRFAIPEALVPMRRHVLACAAGDCVFLDRYTPHRALPNRSEAARWSLVVWIAIAVHAEAGSPTRHASSIASQELPLRHAL